jgi:hypothetical protein
MILEAAVTGMDWVSIIAAVGGIGLGGFLLKFYNSWKDKRDKDRAHEDEPEQFIRNLLTDQVDDLIADVKDMRARMEELLVSNAQLDSENRALLLANHELINKNTELIEMNQKLLDKIDSLTL